MSCYCKFSVSPSNDTVGWVGLQCSIVVFPDHTHLHFVLFKDQVILRLFYLGLSCSLVLAQIANHSV